MYYQIGINENRKCRWSNTRDCFSYVPQTWMIFKTKKGAQRRLLQEVDHYSTKRRSLGKGLYTFQLLEFMDEAEIAAANLVIMREGVAQLRRYLDLPKFYAPNNSVNISDIFLRLDEIETGLL